MSPINHAKHNFFYYIQIDPQFTAEDRQVLHESLNSWQNKTNHGFSWKPIETRFMLTNCDPIIQFQKRFTYEEEIQAKLKYYGPFLKGYIDHPLDGCQPQTIHLITDRMENRQQYKAVTLHEIGHGLGLSHNQSYSIMNVQEAEKLDGPTDLDVYLFFKQRSQ